ncbi:MAG: proprionate catabolism activator, Fis family [Firmicutes bacterium]|nr:proprionate catabolism activator, Fis family [Bacillota bacterium]
MKITIVAPIQGIIDTVNGMLAKKHFAKIGEIEAVPGDLESGVESACHAVERGADVIISRGGTASLIARNLDIPVVEIQVSAFDILRALKQVGTVTGTVGVVFTRRLLFECEKLGALIGLSVKEIFLENELLEKEKILSAYQEGISTFIGDASSVRILRQHGFDAVAIESSEDAIAKAIIEAENLVGVRKKEQEKAELLRTIINASTDGVIAIDKEGRIGILNPVAEQVFQINSVSAIGQYIGDVIPSDKLRECLTTDHYEQEGIKSFGDKLFAIKRIPIKLDGSEGTNLSICQC